MMVEAITNEKFLLGDWISESVRWWGSAVMNPISLQDVQSVNQ
jgi:hypothetical protein